VLVTRQPNQPGGHGPDDDPGGQGDLAARLQTAMALLPPTLGGAPSQPLEVGRASRVVTPSQRAALAVRDGGGVFPDCDRPLAWCEGHHLSIGWRVARPTWPTWPWSARPSTGRSTRAAGSSPAAPTDGSAPPVPTNPTDTSHTGDNRHRLSRPWPTAPWSVARTAKLCCPADLQHTGPLAGHRARQGP
jgi:hypothetical protein